MMANRYQCPVCQRLYDVPTAVRRGYRCHGQPLERTTGRQRDGRQPAPDVAADGDLPAPTSSVEARVISPPRDNQVDALAAEGLLAAMSTSTFALEVHGDGQGRRFVIRAQPPTLKYLEAQLKSVYGQIWPDVLDPHADPAIQVSDLNQEVAMATLRLMRIPALGLRTFRDGDFEQADPIRGVLGAFCDFTPQEAALAQLVLRPPPQRWERPYMHLAMNPMDRRETEQLHMPGSCLAVALGAVGLGILLLGGWALTQAGYWWMSGLLLLAFLMAGYVALDLAGGARLKAWARLVTTTMPAAVAQPEAVARKLHSPAFEFQLRLLALAPTRAQARARLVHMITAFRQFNSAVGNGLKAEETGFDPRDLTSGWQRPLGRPLDVLSAAEIASLWHLPVGDDVALIERTMSRHIAPLPASVDQVPGGALVGVVAGDPAQTPIHLSPQAMGKHKLLVGKTQKGKSTLMAQLALAHIQAGDGLVYLDPHGGAARSLLGHIPRERVDDVIYIDFGSSQRVIGWNPLATADEETRKTVVDSFIYAGERVWADFWGPRMESALRFALLALTEANQEIGAQHPEHQLTISDIDSMLTLGLFKARVLDRYVNDIEVHRWFRHYYGTLYEAKRQDIINPVQTKIHRFTGTPAIRRIFGQSRSTISFDQMVRQHQIVLCNLDVGTVGPKNTGLLGALFLTYLELAIRRNPGRAQGEGRGMAVIVDEFQQIPFNYQDLLAELQKMGANFTMSTQSLSQLDAQDRTLRGAILGNVDSLMAFQVSAMDGETLTPELGAGLQVDDLTNLPDYQCFVRTVRGHEVMPLLRLHTLPLPPPSPAIEEGVLSRLPRYTRTVQEAEEILEKHRRYWYSREHSEYQQAKKRAKTLIAAEELARSLTVEKMRARGISGSIDEDALPIQAEDMEAALRQIDGEASAGRGQEESKPATQPSVPKDKKRVRTRNPKQRLSESEEERDFYADD